MEYFTEVKAIPHKARSSRCKDILEAFCKSGVAIAVINDDQLIGSPRQMYDALYKMVQFNAYPVKIYRRKNQVFLERIHD